MAKSLSMRITNYYQKLFLFPLLMIATLPALGTAPPIGTSTFNNNFSGNTNLIPSSASPATVTNVGNTSEATGILASGWDFTVASSGTVSGSVSGAGANPGGASDFCIRLNALGGSTFQYAGGKSDDGSAFSLQSVYLKLNITAGAPATILVTGYRNGVAVPGAILTVSNIANQTWTAFTTSTVSAFSNVTEFRFTQSGTSATITFAVIDQITIAASLPLTLGNFSGQRQGSHVMLDWTTFSEQNTRDFEVQRAADGNDYTTVGQVPAAGNSVSPEQYSYTDELSAAITGPLLYRLKMSDLDGVYTYSPVLKVDVPGNAPVFSIFPNPYKGSINLSITSPTPDKAVVSILDMTGKRLQTVNLSLQQGSTLFALPSMATPEKGVYLLMIHTSTQNQTLKVIKEE